MDTDNYQGHDLSLFFEDNLKIFLFKKTEKIALALYLMTNHLSDKESLKTNIRELANNLIKDIISLNSGQKGNMAFIKLKEDFLSVNTYLNLASVSGLISNQNINIISDEILRLNKDIQGHKENLNSISELKRSFFVVESKIKSENFNLVDKGQNTNKGHLIPHSEQNVLKKDEKNQEFDKGHIEEKKNNYRTEEIMKIIKDNGKVTIKDISLIIKDCSEKTIQRELLKMVSLNLIKKEGERRWSTYSIN